MSLCCFTVEDETIPLKTLEADDPYVKLLWKAWERRDLAELLEETQGYVNVQRCAILEAILRAACKEYAGETEENFIYSILDIDGVNRQGREEGKENALEAAVCCPTAFQLLLTYNLPENFNINEIDPRTQDCLLHTFIIRAISTEHNIPVPEETLDCLRLLLSFPKLDINWRNCRYKTPLDIALSKGKLEVVNLLLEHKERMDFDGVLEEDARSSRQSMVGSKLYRDLSKTLPLFEDQQKDGSMLLPYLNRGDENGFREAFTSAVNDPSQSHLLKESWRPHSLLCYAVRQDLRDTIALLLEHGADPTIDARGIANALMVAISRSSPPPVLRMLLDAIEDPKKIDIRPVNFAAMKCHTSEDAETNFKMLLSKVDLPNIINDRFFAGNTALHFATFHKYEPVILEVLQRGGNLLTENVEHRTPLPDVPFSVLQAFFDGNVIHTPSRNNNITESLTFKFEPMKQVYETYYEENIDLFTNIGVLKNKNEQPSMTLLKEISKVSNLKSLVTHPLCRCYIYLKWRQLRVFYWINFLFYLHFCIFLTTHVIISSGKTVGTDDTTADNQTDCFCNGTQSDFGDHLDEGQQRLTLAEEGNWVEANLTDYGGHRGTTHQSAFFHSGGQRDESQQRLTLGEEDSGVEANLTHDGGHRGTTQQSDSFHSGSHFGEGQRRLTLAEEDNWVEANFTEEEANHSTTDTDDPIVIGLSTSLLAICLICLLVREIIQMRLLTACVYWQLAENWLEMFVFVLSFITVVNRELSTQCGALAIFLAWFEFLLLLGKYPDTSVRIGMFQLVFLSSLKSLLVNGVLILGFAFSFFVIFREDTEEGSLFPNLFTAVFKTLVMMSGEFETGDLYLSGYPSVSYVIVACFVFLVAVAFMNLLNGTAFYDIKEIRDDATLLSTLAYINYLYFLETMLKAGRKYKWARYGWHFLKFPEQVEFTFKSNDIIEIDFKPFRKNRCCNLRNQDLEIEVLDEARFASKRLSNFGKRDDLEVLLERSEEHKIDMTKIAEPIEKHSQQLEKLEIQNAELRSFLADMKEQMNQLQNANRLIGQTLLTLVNSSSKSKTESGV